MKISALVSSLFGRDATYAVTSQVFVIVSATVMDGRPEKNGSRLLELTRNCVGLPRYAA